MELKTCTKESFVVIGKEGSTSDGAGFIQKLWDDANAHFEEVQHLAKKNEDGTLCGIWGAMSDFSHSFLPWENFSEGLYLAGVECHDDAEAPEGWTKWVIPGYKYIYVARESDDVFQKVIAYMNDNSLRLAGAVHDFTCPKAGKNYLYFPIGRIDGENLEGHVDGCQNNKDGGHRPHFVGEQAKELNPMILDFYHAADNADA